ncbi:MAG: hypothetical protein ACOYOU_21295 [Kiritimatiellia bacterium]
MRQRLILAAGLSLALLAILAVARFGLRRQPSQKNATTAASVPQVVSNRFSRNVVENFRLNGRPGVTSYPLIELGACRVEKPRLGGFRLGVGDVLTFERLEINLPIENFIADTNMDTRATLASPTNAMQTVDGILSRSLDLSAFRRMANIKTPVSSVTITDLRISLVHGTNRVFLITAASARIANRANILLRNCEFLDRNLHSMTAAKAHLREDPNWRMIPEDGDPVAVSVVTAAVCQRMMGSPPSNQN